MLILSRGTCLLAVLLICTALPAPSTAQVPETPKTEQAQAAVPNDSTGTGYLSIRMRRGIDSLYVVLDGRYDEARYVANVDTIPLPAGERELTIATSRTWDVTTTTTVFADSVKSTKLQIVDERNRETYLQNSSYPVLKTGANLRVETDPDATVLVNGEVRGTGATQLRLSSGKYVVRTRHPVAGEEETQVTVTDDPPRMTEVVLYTKPSKKLARRLSFAPGFGQLHKGDTARGLAVLGGFAVATIGSVQQHFSFASSNSEYEDARQFYESASTEEDALRYGNLAEQQYDAARTSYRNRNVLVSVATGLYLYGVLDAWLTAPDDGYRTPVSNSPRVRPLFGANGQTGVALTLSF